MAGRRGDGNGEMMNKNESARVPHEHKTIRTLEVIEVEVSAEDAADDDVGVAPERVKRQPNAPEPS
jgi:hypothetical protein